MDDQKDYQQFIEKIYRAYGIDLSLYKEAQMKRRLTSLREKRGFHNFQTYFDQLEKDKDLKNEFFDRITINVSEFFRNPNRWQYLDETLIPMILSENRRPRFWSAACSTGEEPYTLAMLLSKHMRLEQVDILATDIDDNAMDQAKTGVYSDRVIKEVPANLLTKYFTKVNNSYVIDAEIKRCVTFKKHNLLADVFPSQMDLIICRNVMIYFTDEAKDKLYYKFSNALRPGGYFFVGSTEQIFQPNKYHFESVAPFFYKKIQ